MPTKEELFPKEKFPLRARKTVAIPEKNFCITMEVYYQRPPGARGNRAHQMGMWLRTEGPTDQPTLTLAFSEERTNYLEQDGKLHEVSREELRLAMAKKDAAIAEACGEAFIQMVEEMQNSTPWESF